LLSINRVVANSYRDGCGGCNRGRDIAAKGKGGVIRSYLEKILLSEPVNALAKIVNAQTNCEDFQPLNADDIKVIIKKLVARQKEIRGVMSRNQYKNRKHFRDGAKQRYNDVDRRLLQKAMENGQRINFFEELYVQLKAQK